MGAAVKEHANGAAAAPARSAVHTVDVKLEGDYEGWVATMRVNPPMRVMEELRSGDEERFRVGLGDVVLAWNFVDDQGERLPLPRDGIDWDALPYDLVAVLVRAYGAFLEARTAVPKETSTASEPSSSSVA